MKIAMLSWESLHSIRVGGIAPHVSELAAALANRGHEVRIFTRMADGQARYDRVGDVHYHRCPYEPQPEFVTSMERMSDSLAWHVAEEEAASGHTYDIVHGHDWLVGPALRRVKNNQRRPVVVTIHSTEYGRCGNELFWHGQSRRIRELEWEATYLANRVICVSESLRKEVQWLYSVPNDKTFAIYNGVDVRPFDVEVDTGSVRRRFNVGLDEPCVLFAGRLAWQKGPDLLVEAMPLVLEEHPRTKFLFAGEGDMRAQLEARCAAMGGSAAARFVGYRSGADLVSLFKTADVVCVPSRNEPFGIVILEAWSATKPVVATRTGGPAEFVRHGDTGWTVPTDVASIGDGLDRLLSDENKALRMGRNGRKEAETRFSWENIASQTEAAYMSIHEDRKAAETSAGRLANAEAAAMSRVPARRNDPRQARRPADAPTGLGLRPEGTVIGSDADRGPTEEQIRRRAYQIYVARGCAPGDPVADWLQAERELRGGR